MCIIFFLYFCSMKLSVIIPVYNVKDTLARCVRSITGQGFRDYELLLIDDCSTDGSGSLCDQLSKEDNHIRVIHRKENGGLSEARNTGLRKCHGQYIMFVDSDDFIADNCLREWMMLINVHPDYDLLEFPVYMHYGSPKQRKLLLTNHVYTDMQDYWLNGETYRHCYAWNKIYRAELFKGVSFPKGKVFEDVHTLPLLLQKAQMVATTDIGLYYYCYNPKGITNTATGNELHQLLEAHLNYLNTHIDKIDITSESFARYYAHVLNIQLDVYEQTNREPELMRLHVQPINLKLKLLKLIGLKKLCQFNKLIHKIR